MELLEELKHIDEDTLRQISDDNIDQSMKEDSFQRFILEIKNKNNNVEIKKIDKISFNEIDLYILKLQLHTGYLFTKEEEQLSQKEKFEILIKYLEFRLEKYKRLGRTSKTVEKLLDTLKGKDK